MGDTDDTALIASLRRAVAAAPDDPELRLHLGELLLEAGRGADAVAEAAQVLQRDPGSVRARALMTRALAPREQPQAQEPAEQTPLEASGPEEPQPAAASDFDWNRAEHELGSPVKPPFVTGADPDSESLALAAGADPNATAVYSSEKPSVTLADVGGMEAVKARLNAAFLAPLQNPRLREMYGASLRGGLLMYGPPGCGKTFIARALAGELGARFLSIGVADVLQQYIGNSERNLHELFQQARRDAPCVVFIDELDTLGQRRRSDMNAMLGVVNQLLTELDGVSTDNDGLFVLGATNQPWAVDPALRRPGRFDRTVLVLPPDLPAREAIFRHHLASRPVEGIDAAELARATDGYSGADIAYICQAASERALLDSAASGLPRYITMNDLRATMRELRPSIGPWLETARNVVTFGEDDGTFGELRAYLKSVKRL